MKKAYEGFEAKKAFAGSEKLPAGSYVAKVIGAKEEVFDWGSKLKIAFDVVEGEYKDFFQHQYDLQGSAMSDAKWKGVFRITVPNDKNEFFEAQKKKFESSMWAFEESNKNFHWDWDETKLKGLLVGVAFGDVEWEYEGRTGWTTQCKFLASVDEVRKGKVKTPKQQELKSKSAVSVAMPSSMNTNSSPFPDVEEIAEEVPF